MGDSAAARERRFAFDRTLNVGSLLAIIAAVIAIVTTGIGIRESISVSISDLRSKNDAQDYRLSALETQVQRNLEDEGKWREWSRKTLEDQGKDLASVLRNLSVLEERTRGRR